MKYRGLNGLFFVAPSERGASFYFVLPASDSPVVHALAAPPIAA